MMNLYLKKLIKRLRISIQFQSKSRPEFIQLPKLTIDLAVMSQDMKTKQIQGGNSFENTIAVEKSTCFHNLTF